MSLKTGEEADVTIWEEEREGKEGGEKGRQGEGEKCAAYM